MSTDRDATRIVRSWLRTDEHESADRVLDTVLALLDATPQRRAWWPARRIADMNTFAKLAIGPRPPSWSSRSSGSASCRAGSGRGAPRGRLTLADPFTLAECGRRTAGAVDHLPAAGPLAAGRHTLTEDGTVFSIQVPAGWSSSGPNCSGCAPDGGWLERGPEGSGDPASVWAPVWSVDGVVAGPLHTHGRRRSPLQTATATRERRGTIPGPTS